MPTPRALSYRTPCMPVKSSREVGESPDATLEALRALLFPLYALYALSLRGPLAENGAPVSSRSYPSWSNPFPTCVPGRNVSARRSIFFRRASSSISGVFRVSRAGSSGSRPS